MPPMRSLKLTAIRTLKMMSVPRPEIRGDHDVLLKLSSIGVCGSDVHYYKTGRIGSQVITFPYALGHECSAVVEAVGAGVKNVRVGQLVAVEPATSCHECDQCRMGRENTCRKLTFLGTPGQGEGCLSEYIVMRDECCFPVPAGIDRDAAALCEPLSIGLYTVRHALPTQGASAAIFGGGPIGLSVLLPLKSGLARRVYATDRLEYRCDVLRRYGADWAGNPDCEDVVATIQQAEPLGVDMAFECAGQQETIDQAVKVLRPGGKLMLVGIPEFERVSFAIDLLRRKELTVQNVRRQNHCVAPAIEMIAKNRIDPRFMATHRFSFDDAPKAFELVEAYADKVIKAMIHFD